MATENARLKRLLAEQAEELAIVKKSGHVLREEPEVKYVFMAAHSALFKVTTMSRVLAVSRSGFYAWHNRVGMPSARVQRETLTAKVIEHMGAEYFVWASDYPHIDASFGVVKEIKERLAPLPLADQRKGTRAKRRSLLNWRDSNSAFQVSKVQGSQGGKSRGQRFWSLLGSQPLKSRSLTPSLARAVARNGAHEPL